MDNGYTGFDQAIVRAAASHLSFDTLLLPSGNNMQLPGIYDAASRIKCEEVESGLSDIFSRAAAQLCEKALRLPCSSTPCDLRALRGPVPSSVPMFETVHFIASSNSFNFLGSPEYIPSLHSSASCQGETMEKGIKREPEVDGYNLAGHTISPSSFSGNILPSRELLRAASATIPATRLHNSTPTPSTEGISASLHLRSVAQPDISDMVASSISDSTNSSSKQDSPLQSAEDSDADPKNQGHNNKRRKTQQKKVVCVPIGGESKQKGEAPPSDLWAWRKYGQKPIKGSPYPRGYYRCSSSKGCSARKQVERSRSDPTMLVVTYTSEHNHPWPANRSSSTATGNRPSPKGGNTASREDARSSEVAGNLFSSIINSPDEQVVSSLMDSLQDEESFCLQRDVDLWLSRSTTGEDDVFDDLGELPELSAIFSKGIVEDGFNDERSNSVSLQDSCHTCSISSWASSALAEKQIPDQTTVEQA